MEVLRGLPAAQGQKDVTKDVAALSIDEQATGLPSNRSSQTDRSKQEASRSAESQPLNERGKSLQENQQVRSGACAQTPCIRHSVLRLERLVWTCCLEEWSSLPCASCRQTGAGAALKGSSQPCLPSSCSASSRCSRSLQPPAARGSLLAGAWAHPPPPPPPPQPNR